MRCVIKATPIQFIDGNKLKSCRTGLTNHTWPLSHPIMPLVINAFGADTQTHIQRHTYRHTNQNNFKKPGICGLWLCTPGLTIQDVLKIELKALLKKREKQIDKISYGWWWRWPQLRFSKGDSFTIFRDQVANYVIFKIYLDILGETFTKYEIKDKSAQIYSASHLLTTYVYLLLV